MSVGSLIRIGTHNGKFHSDEVLGCFLLKQLPEYKDAIIKRSRDPKVLETCDIVIDVGGVYDHSQKRYDHHQRGFEETLNTITGVQEDIILSSAGLVWAHYGKDIIKALVKQKLTSGELQDIYRHLYHVFIKEIDGIDNGVEASDPPFRYRVLTDLSSRISRLNPNAFTPEWDEEEQFMKAYELAGKEFTEALQYTIKMWLPSKSIVREALKDRFSVDPSGTIIKLNSPGINWRSHLGLLEDEMKITPLVLYALFPDSNDGWRVQAVPRGGGFGLRRQLLPNCLALREQQLVAACGVMDAVFVHASGFIGGAKSYKGALKMAQISLDDDDILQHYSLAK